ncbi:UNVERIFIED_CONTAM: hypothetical protein Sradi_3874100 [Sesamum radiatum]|uniref:Uncharacterized protein n=1 Tax=Sesamum radiatum TaxID=300843 RepID=A0AAW2Q2E9_SESRA
MGNQLLQDNALGVGKIPEASSSTKHPSVKSPLSTLASPASIANQKGKHQTDRTPIPEET